MSRDLLDRLITDIIETAQLMMTTDPVDLAAFAGGQTTIEKEFASIGHAQHHRKKAKRPMDDGVHRAVC
jgi:glutamate decarboxylase